MVIYDNKKERYVIPDSFEPITQKELIPGDIPLIVHGNKTTEWHGRNRRVEFKRSTLPPFHAGIVHGQGARGEVVILDQELRGTASFLSEYSRRSSYRIDIVRPNSTPDQRAMVQDLLVDIANKELRYDWRGFAAFGSQMPYMSWMKIIKPSDKFFFCSDVVAYIWFTAGVIISFRSHNFTAPVDIQLFPIIHNELGKIYTFKKRGEVL